MLLNYVKEYLPFERDNDGTKFKKNISQHSVVLKSFTKFSEKHLLWSTFFVKKESIAAFSCGFCEMVQKHLLGRLSRAVFVNFASVNKRTIKAIDVRKYFE